MHGTTVFSLRKESQFCRATGRTGPDDMPPSKPCSPDGGVQTQTCVRGLMWFGGGGGGTRGLRASEECPVSDIALAKVSPEQGFQPRRLFPQRERWTSRGGGSCSPEGPEWEAVGASAGRGRAQECRAGAAEVARAHQHLEPSLDAQVTHHVPGTSSTPGEAGRKQGEREFKP